MESHCDVKRNYNRKTRTSARGWGGRYLWTYCFLYCGQKFVDTEDMRRNANCTNLKSSLLVNANLTLILLTCRIGWAPNNANKWQMGFNSAFKGLKNLTLSWFKTFAVFWILYAFFWVIPRRLNFICRRFRTLCLFHLHRQIGVEFLHLSAYEDGTECSETLEYKIQTPGNYPE